MMMTRTEWDLVVIGGGPAGAVAAQQAARAGLATLLVERKSFPRFKVCGCCVSARALELLRSIGLRDVTATLKGQNLSRFWLQSRGRYALLPLGGGMSISRAELDHALVRAAVEAGAVFMDQISAIVEPVRTLAEPYRRVTLNPAQGEPYQVRAQVVVAADGLRGSSLAQSRELNCLVARHGRIGLGATLPRFCQTYSAGTIFMGVGSAGYVGLVRLANQQLNVAAAVDRRFVQQHGGPSGAVAALLQESRLPMLDDLNSTNWHGTLSLTRQLSSPAQQRLFVIGDAAGYVEPFTGEGICWALESAVAVQPLLRSAVSRWTPQLQRRWQLAYRRMIRRRYLCRGLATALRHPRLVTALIRVLASFPQIAAPLVWQTSGGRTSLKGA